MKKALQYFGGATVCALLAYLLAVVLANRISALAAPLALAGFVLLMLGWWHFAKWIWALLVGGKR